MKNRNFREGKDKFALQVSFGVYGICPLRPTVLQTGIFIRASVLFYFVFAPMPWKGLMELVTCRHQATLGDGDMSFFRFWTQELSFCLSATKLHLFLLSHSIPESFDQRQCVTKRKLRQNKISGQN